MKNAAFVAFLMSCLLCTGMSRKPKFTITIHAEASQEDNPRTIFNEVVQGQKLLFKLMPEISHMNIAAFQPFPSSEGNGNGVALKLDFRGTNALEIATRSRPGQLLLAKVNGKSVDILNIDQPVLDGIVTIWNGVPDEVIAELEKKYPHINQSRSAGNGIEMTPTTKKEKREALRRSKEEAKRKAEAEAAKRKDGGQEAPSVPDDLPRGAATNQIPLEGAAPQPALPQR